MYVGPGWLIPVLLSEVWKGAPDAFFIYSGLCQGTQFLPLIAQSSVYSGQESALQLQSLSFLEITSHGDRQYISVEEGDI